MAKEKQENELETIIQTDGSIDVAVEQKGKKNPGRQSLMKLPRIK